MNSRDAWIEIGLASFHMDPLPARGACFIIREADRTLYLRGDGLFTVVETGDEMNLDNILMDALVTKQTPDIEPTPTTLVQH